MDETKRTNFLAWVRSSYGESISSECERILKDKSTSHLPALATLNRARFGLGSAEIQAAGQMDRLPFDSD
jgi:hypothetical protein